MKYLLLISFMISSTFSFSQSPDYISIRKKNSRVIKNFYTGSDILLQTIEGAYWQGPIKNINNDSLFLTIYDIRFYPTPWGSKIRDTISKIIVGLPFTFIKRIHVKRHRSFFERNTGPLLMIGGGGYLALNLLNGTWFQPSAKEKHKIEKLAVGLGTFTAGYFISRLLHTDGFTTKRQDIMYIKLNKDKEN